MEGGRREGRREGRGEEELEKLFSLLLQYVTSGTRTANFGELDCMEV